MPSLPALMVVDTVDARKASTRPIIRQEWVARNLGRNSREEFEQGDRVSVREIQSGK